MEIQSPNTSNNQDNRKMSIKMGGGGGNIGGFILLGGALAAATFIGSAFAKSRKGRSNNHHQVQPLPPELDSEKTDDTHTRNGLTLVLPDSSKNESADVESGSPLLTHNFVLEEKGNLQVNGALKELVFSQPIDESVISREECTVLNNISSDLIEDVNDDKSCDGIEEILISGETIEAEDSSDQIPIEDIREDLETPEKRCESDAEIEEEEIKETKEEIEETDLHKNDYQEVKEECKSDHNITVKCDEEGLEGTSVEVESQLTEDEEIICSIEASEVMPTQESIDDEEIICSIVASEVKPTQEFIEDEEMFCSTEASEVKPTKDLIEGEKVICSIEESEVKPTQEFSLPTTDSVPKNVNKDEKEFQHIQTEKELELTESDYQDAEQKDCLMEAFDHSPKVLTPKDGNSNTEDGGLVLTEDSLEVESAENIAEKCVVSEISNSDACCDEEFQVSEKQGNLVVEILEQVNSIEEDSAENVAEDNQLARSDDEEGENEGNNDKHIAVDCIEQLQFSEQEDGKDEENAADYEGEDTCDKAKESSQGTKDSSMESNPDAVWSVVKSAHEELTKYLLDDLKIINNNPTDKKSYLSKVNLLPVRILILVFLAPLLLLLLLLLVHIFKPSFYYAPL